MSRGRKPNKIIRNDWGGIFLNSVGSYVQMINSLLSNSIKLEPLSKYIRIVGGYAFKSSNYSSTGVPVIRISDFNNERIILDNVKFYRESDDLKKYELHTGDIVIALTGGTIAKLGIVQKGTGTLYLNQRVGKFEILNNDVFENEYVYWIARSVQSIIKNLAWGAAIPNVSPKQIEKLKFPIPEKEIQKGIIKFLNDLKDNKIINDKIYFNSDIEEQIILMHTNQVNGTNLSIELTSQLTLVKQLRQSFLREAMQGKLVEQNKTDEPATELLAKIKVQKEQLIKEKKIRKQKPLLPIIKEEIPFEIPENWVWCRLAILSSKIGSGSTPKGGNYTDKGFPFFRSQNIHNNGLVFNDIKFVSNEVQEKMKGTVVLPKDILLNITGGSLGRCALVPNGFKQGNVSQHVCIIRPILADNSFIHELVLSPLFQGYIFNSTTGAGREGLPKYNLEQFVIPLPPLSEQKRIVAKLDELRAYCDSLEDTIKNSQTQNEMLLQQVLREALGLKIEKEESIVEAEKTKQILTKFDSKTTFMEIVELLKRHGKLHAEELWKMSKHPDDIDAFYAELKKQIELNKTVKESKEKGYLELV